MTNRTLQFWGGGSAIGGTEPISITANINNSVVYSGTIPTDYTTDPSRVPEDQVLLFTCEIPMNLAGTYPMAIYLDHPVGVSVFFEQIYSNYMAIVNSVYSPAQVEILKYGLVKSDKVEIMIECAVPPLTQGEIAILNEGDDFSNPIQQDIIIAHNLMVYISSGPDGWRIPNNSSDQRSNVVINGVAVSRNVEPVGTWGWMVMFDAETAGSITCDLNLLAGYE
jgi:hypothetical protein